jgi:hypothetical protein
MEIVEVVALKSFVNRFTGSMNKKGRTFIPMNVAEELVAMGLVEYANKPKGEKETDPKKSSSSPTSGEDGKDKQSVSSPAETVSAKPKSSTPKSKTGK